MPETPHDEAFQAMFALGRLDGAMRYSPRSALRAFAARTVRQLLIAALRQEGHAFTDRRFHAWFAGLVTLSDPIARHARPPRSVCEAILTELGHSTWPDLAEASSQLATAFLAPRDHGSANAREQALMLTQSARALIARCTAKRPLSPLASLYVMHDQIAGSMEFAPVERPLHDTPGLRASLPPSPRWAVEMLFGECLVSAGCLPWAVPMPDVVRLETLQLIADDARTTRAAALARVIRERFDALADNTRLIRSCDALLERRRSSRAPALFEMLAGFGPLRSSQIERIIGASRLGVRGMLDTLEAAGLVERSKVNGAILFEARALLTDGSNPAEAKEQETTFSGEALDEYEASLAAIDRLLSRTEDH